MGLKCSICGIKLQSVERESPPPGIDIADSGPSGAPLCKRRECRKEAFARTHEDKMLFDILPFANPDSIDDSEVLSDDENIARLAKEDEEIRRRVDKNVASDWRWERVIQANE